MPIKTDIIETFESYDTYIQEILDLWTKFRRFKGSGVSLEIATEIECELFELVKTLRREHKQVILSLALTEPQLIFTNTLGEKIQAFLGAAFSGNIKNLKVAFEYEHLDVRRVSRKTSKEMVGSTKKILSRFGMESHFERVFRLKIFNNELKYRGFVCVLKKFEISEELDVCETMEIINDFLYFNENIPLPFFLVNGKRNGDLIRKVKFIAEKQGLPVVFTS